MVVPMCCLNEAQIEAIQMEADEEWNWLVRHSKFGSR